MSTSKKVAYSPGEKKALDALRAEPSKRLSSIELIARVYGSSPPFHARQSIMGTMKSLAAKVEKNAERFRLYKTDRAGPVPISFWIEEKETTR